MRDTESLALESQPTADPGNPLESISNSQVFA